MGPARSSERNFSPSLLPQLRLRRDRLRETAARCAAVADAAAPRVAQAVQRTGAGARADGSAVELVLFESYQQRRATGRVQPTRLALPPPAEWSPQSTLDNISYVKLPVNWRISDR